mgnify:CR=1 FL=1
MEKKERGITLIALVVTIIVLLILAGISISMLTGQNGILNRAAQAKNDTSAASDLEYLQVEATAALMDYYQGNDNKNEDEYILEKWKKNNSNNKISVDEKDKTVTYNGKIYAMSDIIGNESEKKKISESNMNQITVSNAEKKEDKELLSNGKIRVIVEEESGMRAAIPNGFYYVTGKPSNGMVISDIYGDDDNNTKGGNQFVWIPCSADENATASTNNGTTVTYEKVYKTVATTWKKKYTGDSGNSFQWYYTIVPTGNGYANEGQAITDWKDEGGNLDSVKKYGGFYIARYEAGLPENDKLWAKEDGATYGWTNNQAAGSLNGTRDTTSMIPVSKKNNASWNRISQKNAVKVSEKMYEGSKTVTSSLVDSYAWDTILEWYTKTGTNCTSSTSYGNYYDTPFGKTTEANKLSLKNVLYAVHTYDDTKGWKTYAANYHLTTKDLSASEMDPKKEKVDNVRTVYEIGTGGSEYTKKNNIYDMAGNMWEWTTEVGDHSVTNTVASETKGNYAVLRGGSFNCIGSSSPVSYRYGGVSSDGSSNFSIGFRVVLYITL